MKKWLNIENNILPCFFTALLIFIWEMIIRAYAVPQYLLPAPSSIIYELYESRHILLFHTGTTLVEAIIGFFIAVVMGLSAACLMNRFKLLKNTIYPLLVISQTVPIIALAPLFMIWMGYGIMPKIAIVILVCFFPITVSVAEGLAALDKDLINLLRTMKATWWQIFTKAEFPAVMPAFFSGLKIAATYSIMGAVIGEWIGAKSGLGIYMTRSMNSFRTSALFAAVFIIVVLSMVLYKVIQLMGEKIMPWNKG